MFNGTIEAKSAGILGGGPASRGAARDRDEDQPEARSRSITLHRDADPDFFHRGNGDFEVRDLLVRTRDIDGNGKEGCGARRTVYGPGTTLGNSNDPSCITGT